MNKHSGRKLLTMALALVLTLGCFAPVAAAAAQQADGPVIGPADGPVIGPADGPAIGPADDPQAVRRNRIVVKGENQAGPAMAVLGYLYQVTGNGVNVRDKAGMDGNIIDRAAMGDTVLVRGMENGWAQLATGGYMAARLLALADMRWQHRFYDGYGTLYDKNILRYEGSFIINSNSGSFNDVTIQISIGNGVLTLNPLDGTYWYLFGDEPEVLLDEGAEGAGFVDAVDSDTESARANQVYTAGLQSGAGNAMDITGSTMGPGAVAVALNKLKLYDQPAGEVVGSVDADTLLLVKGVEIDEMENQRTGTNAEWIGVQYSGGEGYIAKDDLN